MKRFEQILVGLAFIGLLAFAHNVYAGGLIQDTPFTGDSILFTYNVINSTTAVQVSTFSFTRNYLICRNNGAMEVYASTGAMVGTNNNVNQGYLIAPSTTTQHTFTSTDHAALWLIGKLGSAVTSVVTCEEERY